MSKKQEEIYLIDGSSYIHRAYHAMGGLSNSKGFPTGAAFGFTNMIVKTLKDMNPKWIAVVFDAKGKNFRHDKYPAYKAHRPAMPEDLRLQIPWIYSIIDAYRLPSLSVEGFEADDIIATMTRKALKRDWKVIVVSADKDLMQLVGGSVTMWDPQRDTTYDATAVAKKFGVPPDQLLDLMALVGDSSDNIPGVPGIGPKTASSLIQQFSSLEAIYEHLEQIPQEKVRTKLAANKESAFLSRELARLDENVPLDKDLDDLGVVEQDTERLREIFRELEFKRLIGELPARKALDFSGYCAITSMDELNSWLRRIKDLGVVSVDVETTSEQPVQAKLVGISLCAEEGKACYIPVGHTEGLQLPKKEVLEAIRPILEDENVKKIGQNIKYDVIVFKKEGIEVRGIVSDTMLASYILDPSRRGHSLDDLGEIFLEHRTITIKELIGTGKSQIVFSQVDISRAVDYACEDAEVAFRVAAVLMPRIEAEGLTDLYRKVELPLIPVLADMELAGVRVDVPYLEKLSNEFGSVLDVTEAEIYRLAGESFNINSPKQLGEILFSKLGLKPIKKTKSGISTAVDVLEELALVHDLPRKILEYRSIFKLKSTYVDSLITLADPISYRIHTSYNQAVAATGRLSSSDPNLQNIPIRTTEGRKIRKAFVAEKGHTLVCGDYSQIELRIMAHVSGDARLMQAFTAGEDIHAITAASVFECSPAQVTPEMRRKAKAINFGIMYGMGPYKLASQIGVGMKMARQYLDDYYKTYSGVRKFMEELPERAAVDGFVTTILDRKRFIPDLNNPNKIAKQAAHRVAINTVMQGSAADLMKLAMIRVHESMKRNNIPGRMILQVHDELVLEVRDDAAQDARALLKKEMEEVYTLSVPLVVDTNIGKNWDEAH